MNVTRLVLSCSPININDSFREKILMYQQQSPFPFVEGFWIFKFRRDGVERRTSIKSSPTSRVPVGALEQRWLFIIDGFHFHRHLFLYSFHLNSILESRLMFLDCRLKLLSDACSPGCEWNFLLQSIWIVFFDPKQKPLLGRIKKWYAFMKNNQKKETMMKCDYP